jgi:CRP-like cAMP-binding protein
MAQPQHATVRNQLLSGLSPADFGLLQPHLQPVGLELREMMLKAKEPIPHVTFIERGIASGLAGTSDGRFEIGMVGFEGLVGLPVVLGIERSSHSYLVQGAGGGLQITPKDFRAAMGKSSSLQGRFLRYAHTFMVQTAQTAFANAAFTVEARLARWILMTHDRTEGDELLLTHDFLSMMLGVRRPGVTVAVQVLEGNRLIRATRGRITVLDRDGLEAVADDAYGLAEAEYDSAMAQLELPEA